jgi:hypothetical protein
MALTGVSRSSAPMPELEPAIYAMREPGLRKLAVIENPIRPRIGKPATVQWRLARDNYQFTGCEIQKPIDGQEEARNRQRSSDSARVFAYEGRTPGLEELVLPWKRVTSLAYRPSRAL